MTTPRQSNPLVFIQKANSSIKFKRSLTLQEVLEVLHNQHQVRRMNERGLFIALLAELINHFYINFSLRAKTFLNEVNPPMKIQRRRRQDGQDNPPKRKPRKARVNLGNVDLNQLASQSVSNPSNLQAQGETQRLVALQEKKDNSKGTHSSNEDLKAPIVVDFNAEIAKLGDLQAEVPDFQPQYNNDINEISDNSSGSNSTAISSNIIPNLSQKLRIIGNDISFEGKLTVPRRRAAVAGTTVRRKEFSKIDINITLSQHKDSINRLTIPDKVIQQKSRAFETQKQNQILDQLIKGFSVNVKEQLFNRDNLLRLKHFSKSAFKHEQTFDHGGQEVDFNASQSLFDTQFGAPPSTYLSAGHDESDLNRITHEHFDSNLFRGEDNLTLTKLKTRTRRPKEQIFRKLLWMAPRGQVLMTQNNVQEFGEIEVTMISV